MVSNNLSKWFLVLLTGFVFTACATLPKAEMEGAASWYGRQHQGQKTASGEKFDMHALTAAHRTFPFGTRVRVTSLTTQKEVIVRINDRGPYARDRIIDLSYEAARRIGMIGRGFDQVKLERLP